MACHGAEVQPSGGWRAYVNGPAATGLVAAGLGYAFHVTINNLNYVALVAGVIAIAAGIAAVMSATREQSATRNTKLIVAVVVVLLGAYHVLRSGVIGSSSVI